MPNGGNSYMLEYEIHCIQLLHMKNKLIAGSRELLQLTFG